MARKAAHDPVATMGHNNPPIDEAFLAKKAKALQALGAKLAENKTLAAAATKTRETWISYGIELAEAREAIPSTKMFNAWLKDNDLESYADRNSRTDAMWLSSQSDDLIALIPADLHSPKAIRGWYRKTLKAAIAESGGDFDRAESDPAYADFLGAIFSDDWEIFKAKYEESQNRERYEDMAPRDASLVLLDKLAKHPQPGEVLAALNKRVEGGELEKLLDSLANKDKKVTDADPVAADPATASEPAEEDEYEEDEYEDDEEE